MIFLDDPHLDNTPTFNIDAPQLDDNYVFDTDGKLHQDDMICHDEMIFLVDSPMDYMHLYKFLSNCWYLTDLTTMQLK